MKLVIDDSELGEVLIGDFINKSEDFGKVIVKGEFVGDRGNGRDEMTKEIIGKDAQLIGASEAARIHGVSQSSASKYANGLDLKDENSRNKILDQRSQIADLATSKLMEALGIIDVSNLKLESEVKKIQATSQLANIVEKIIPKEISGSQGQVHLHLHAPKQKDLDKYEVIDV